MTQNGLFALSLTPEPETTPTTPVTLTTREISRFVKYYKLNVRDHSLHETAGVFNNIKRLLQGNPKKGQRPLLPQEIADALKHYAADPFTVSCDPRQRKHIRSFFTYETIVAWLKPMAPRKPVYRQEVPRDPALDSMKRVSETMRVAPLPPPPVIPTESDNDEVTEF